MGKPAGIASVAVILSAIRHKILKSKDIGASAHDGRYDTPWCNISPAAHSHSPIQARPYPRYWTVMTGAVVLPLIAVLAVPGNAQDSAIDVAGWKLTDVGHKPGDDSDRSVAIEKAIPEVDLFYRPSETNSGGSISASFKGCKGLSYNSGFGFDDPPADRAAAVRKEVHEAFAEFAKSCPVKPDAEARLMTGFAEAFAAVDKLMTDKPNVYPKEPAEDGNSQDQSKI